jgi:RNA polymerase sigma-70 factor (ECF subfamily)
VLTTLQGLSYKEAAVVLETTEGTIAWRIHEARRKMRDYLADLDAGRARTRRRPMSDSAVFRLEKALMQLMPVVPSPAAVG